QRRYHGFMMRILLVCIVLLMPAAAFAGDWPTHRADATRSGVTDETLAFPLNEIWRHTAAHAPQPAWPPPARSSYWQNLTHIEPRVIDDSVFQPVASDDAVYFASSADDQ